MALSAVEVTFYSHLVVKLRSVRRIINRPQRRSTIHSAKLRAISRRQARVVVNLMASLSLSTSLRDMNAPISNCWRGRNVQPFNSSVPAAGGNFPKSLRFLKSWPLKFIELPELMILKVVSNVLIFQAL